MIQTAASIATRWQKGKSGGPGRSMGSKDRLSREFLDALCADFTEHGKAAIQDARTSDPGAYLRVIASIMPKEIEIKRPMADLTEDELANAIEFLRAAVASDPGGVRDGGEAETGGEPAGALPALH